MKEDLKRKVDEVEDTGEMNQVEVIQKEMQAVQDEEAQEIQNTCLYESCPKNCVSSFKLGKNVTKMLKTVDETAHKVPPRQIEMPLDETVGLDLMLEKVWNSIETENVGVIGLYGMGGVGKTTLLKRINNELGKKRLDFDVVMWVVVSKDLNLDGIMDNIRKKLRVGDNIWNDCSNKEEKAAKIYQVLKQKKFVLLLDDMWERLDLNMVGVPHLKDTNFQSKVLFTTRSEDVCAKMQAQRAFKVEILMKKEALELFYIKVGEETLKSDPDIPKLAEEMAKECKGLPLALIVVGSAMAGVKSVEAWRHSRNYLTGSSWTAPDLEAKVFSILKFSYDWLPDETHKNCFLYCALYPKDYEIQVIDLIDKWIAEGFLNTDVTKSIQDMRDHGESIIEKLKLSCLLENVENGLFISRMVKMHDVIQDMALWLARDQDHNKKRILVEEDAFTMSQNDVETWKIVSSLNIQYMCTLKVLDLSFDSHKFIKLPPEIGSLVFLEYLSLEGQMRASEFPIQLMNLKNLKFFSLIVHAGDLSSIPLEVISSFQQLRVFRFITDARNKSGKERELLEKLESLPNLQELWIHIKTKKGLKKLLRSTRLQSCIGYLLLEDMDTIINMPLLLATMSKMKHLHQIWFSRLNKVVEASSFSDKCCVSKLRTVSISYCNSITHLTWLKYAPLIQYLEIRNCESLEEVIRDEKEKEKMDNHNLFSSLVELELDDLPKLKSIHDIALPFPSLRSIRISWCPNLKTLPFDSSSAMDKLRHIRGDEKWWDNLEWEDKHKFQSKFKSI